MNKKNGLSIFINNKFSLIGIVVALLAILLCYSSMQINESKLKPIQNEKNIEQNKEKKFSFSFSFGSNENKISREEVEIQQKELKQRKLTFRISGGILGFIALILGIIGSRKKEVHYLVSGAVILGVIGVGWELFLVLLIISIIGLIIGNA